MPRLYKALFPQHHPPRLPAIAATTAATTATTTTTTASSAMCEFGAGETACGSPVPSNSVAPPARCGAAKRTEDDLYVCCPDPQAPRVRTGVPCGQSKCLPCFALFLGRVCCGCQQLVHPNEIYCHTCSGRKWCPGCHIVGIVSSPPLKCAWFILSPVERLIPLPHPANTSFSYYFPKGTS